MKKINIKEIKNIIVERFKNKPLDFTICVENSDDYRESFIEYMCDYCYDNDIILYNEDGDFTSIETEKILIECMSWLDEQVYTMLSIKTILRNEKLNVLLNEN